MKYFMALQHSKEYYFLYFVYRGITMLCHVLHHVLTFKEIAVPLIMQPFVTTSNQGSFKNILKQRLHNSRKSWWYAPWYYMHSDVCGRRCSLLSHSDVSVISNISEANSPVFRKGLKDMFHWYASLFINIAGS